MPRALLAFGLLLLVTSTVGLTALQYFMPPAFDNPLAVNHAGIAHFQRLIDAPRFAPLPVPAFVAAFRWLLGSAWLGYGLMLFVRYRYEVSLEPFALPTVVGLVALIALLFPPSLSSDVYAYAGWGRMLLVHGWSPYDHTLRSFAELGDAAAAVAPVGATATHGPVWVALVWGLFSALPSAELSVQIVALKLAGGAAVVAAAMIGRQVAGLYDRRRAELTFLAIGFNPLFLIEAPGSGHNDALMAATMLGAVALHQRGRPRFAYLLLGVSVGIKFVTAAIVPWLILKQAAGSAPRRQVAIALVALGLVATPSLVGYTAVGTGSRPLDGIRVVFERQVAGIQPEQSDGGSGRADTSSIRKTLPPSSLPRLGLLVLVYAMLSCVVWLADVRDRYMSWWALFCLAVILIGAPVAFAWYLIWPLSGSLLRWDRPGLGSTIACLVIALFLLAKYTMPYAR